MGAPLKQKGIYCIEGMWADNIRDKSSILPILDLLEKTDKCDYIYHDCATREELEFYLKKWKVKTLNKKYPILYLAFHGDIGCIKISNKEDYRLEDISTLLGTKCMGNVIYFGSCLTLNMDKRKIKTFLNNTGAIAAIGYKTSVDWIQSTACDLFVFEALQLDMLDKWGIQKIRKMIKKDYGNLHKRLGLNFVINDKWDFKRKNRSHK